MINQNTFSKIEAETVFIGLILTVFVLGIVLPVFAALFGWID